MAGRLRTMLERAADAELTARRELKAAEDRITELTRQVDDAAARMSTLETELAARLPYPTRERALQQIRGLADRLDEQRRVAADAPEADLAAERTRLVQRTRDAHDLSAALETRTTTSGLLTSASATVEATAARPWEPYLLPAAIAIGGLVVAVALLLANASPVAVIVIAVGALALAGALAYLRRPTGVADVERVRGQLEEQLSAADTSIAHLGPALDLGSEATAMNVDRLLTTLDDERRDLEGEEARRDRAIAATQEVERLTSEVATIAQGAGLPAAPGPTDLEAFGEAIEAHRATANRLTGLQEQASGLRATLATVETRRAELVTTVGEREAEAAAASNTWQEWLGAHDLDPSYDRETAARVIDAVTAAKATVMAMRTLETRHDAQVVERESFETRVADLADLLPAGVAADADPDGAAVLLAATPRQRGRGRTRQGRARADAGRAGGGAHAGGGGTCGSDGWPGRLPGGAWA